VSAEMIEKYLHNLYAVQPDFLYSVSRDFIRNCRTPMLVLSGISAYETDWLS
jgi:hypothetical protein